MEKPLASVIIVTYNAKKYVNACLRAVYQNNYPNFEVVVVDNGSSDGTKEELTQRFGLHSNFHFLELGENKGPAYARNYGVNHSQGQYLAFLDSDTLPQPDWLSAIVDCFEKDKTVGAVQCKLLLASFPDCYDYAGDYLGNFGFLIQRAKEKEIDKGQYDRQDEILSAKSAGMGIRRNVFDSIGGFDADYFMFLEETDLGWRTWLAGYRVIFLPESVVLHEFGTTSILHPKLANRNVKFHGTKNYITTNYKNLGAINLIKILPFHLLSWVVMTITTLIRGNLTEGSHMFYALAWFFLNLPQLTKKRSLIQNKRIRPDRELFPIISRSKPLIYFLKKFFVPQTVDQLRTEGHPKDL